MISNNQYKNITYVVKCKPKTDEEIKEYHRKRLYELSVKTIGEVPQLDELNEEQAECLKKKICGSARSWEAFNNNG